MLFELYVKDFILIDEAVIDFKEGFNTITGETGAGKSMVLGAIALVLGGQANKDHVKIGKETAIIRAGFFTNKQVNLYLENNGFSVDPDIITITREIQAKGKSISRINGQIATLTHLKYVTQFLIDIHGQHDNQVLLNPDEQLNFLDTYGTQEISDFLNEVHKLYLELNQIQKDIRNLELKNKDRQRQMDFLIFQVNELETAGLVDGEDMTLEREFKVLGELDSIQELFERARNWLSGEYGDGVVTSLASFSGAFQKVADYNEPLKNFSERFSELFFMMDDLAKEVVHYQDQLEQNPERLDQVERRLDEINQLKSKYNCQTIAELKLQLKRLRTELESYEQVASDLQTQKIRYELILKKYDVAAHELSKRREKAAHSLEKALMAELVELNMKEAKFKVQLTERSMPGPTGVDLIEFQISTNAGHPLRPLKKVVSGGELSRIMLGIKIVLGQMDAMPTLFFDEIDSGISGLTANVVGEKLAKLSQYAQIICITHLPQIAVFADHHLLIKKSQFDGETLTEIETLSEHTIQEEIARLVGGFEHTETTNQHAREMLLKAAKKKEAYT